MEEVRFESGEKGEGVMDDNVRQWESCRLTWLG